MMPAGPWAVASYVLRLRSEDAGDSKKLVLIGE
jgi:hypothetical protein